MALIKLSLVSFISLLLLHSCIARNDGQQQQQQECRIDRLRALQPTSSVKAEGGITEFWNPDNQQFRCAGVAVLRHTIRPKGLLLPSYTNSPLMVFIEQGQGYHGVVLPGCPETFQSPQEESGERMRDGHQKIQNFRKGDVLAFHAGVVHWLYNNGNQDLVAVAMFDTSNDANQLDNNPQRFYVLGNPQAQQGEGEQGQQQFQGDNVLRGIDAQILADAFKVNQDIATKLQGNNVKEGHIIRLEKELQVNRPEPQQEERQQGQGSYNGLEETSCSQSNRENLDNLDRADIFNPQAGHLTSLNSHHLPILRDIQLSAERGRLQRNAIMAPHYNLNAHSIIYATDGEARIQIVNNQGKTVFDDRLQQGQIVVVPQNFAVVKQAGSQGFRWVAFKTNDNAMITPLAGRTSVFRGLPVSVLANILQISEEDASRLKYNNPETLLFSPQRRSRDERFSDVFEKVLIRGV